ncbi:MAG TPA: hypothetical protein HA365_08650 [Methanocalculus sp.]|nr:hypothetical protein [Methanocalculus sp.]
MASRNRIFFLICMISFLISSGSAVTIQITPDQIDEGDHITATITGLEDGSHFALRMESSINRGDESDFSYQADRLLLPFGMHSSRITLTASPVLEAGIQAKEGDSIKSIIQEAYYGDVSLLQNLGDIPVGTIDYIRVFGVCVDDAPAVDISLTLSGIKEGTEDGSMTFGLLGIRDGIITLTALVDGSQVASQQITIGNPWIRGDFNNNGRVDIGDVARVASMVTGLTQSDPRADFNSDGVVDGADAAKIAWYYVHSISSL